jgi:hypothetical protein
VDIQEGAEMIRAVGRCAYDIYFMKRYMLPESDSIEHIVTGTDQLHLFVHGTSPIIDMNDWSTLGGNHFVSVRKRIPAVRTD